jgi:DNA-binding transcriptional LysR family regulator
MNLKRLETFVQVADRRCFSDVAGIMNVTQSGISRQVKALEEEVGIQLLNRNTSFVDLTPAGRLVYKRAKSLLAQWEQLLQECQGLKTELSGTLKIGASTIAGNYLLPRIIKSFQEKYPAVEFSILIEDSTEIISKLESKKIDFAIVGRDPAQTHFQAKCIAEDRLVLIGNSPDQCISSLEEIKNWPLIVREKGSGTREAMDKAFRQFGVEPEDLHYAMEVSSTESILAMVEAGVGFSFVSHWAVQENVREHINILYELPTDRCFHMVSHETRNTHPLIQAFTQETVRIYCGNKAPVT